MPAPNVTECPVQRCLLSNDVCPSELPRPDLTKIECCCNKDLCNVDFVKLKAIDRMRWMTKV